MHCGEVETAAAGGTAASLEDGGFGGEVGDFLAFGGGLGAVGFD